MEMNNSEDNGRGYEHNIVLLQSLSVPLRPPSPFLFFLFACRVLYLFFMIGRSIIINHLRKETRNQETYIYIYTHTPSLPS
jgi:arginine deiminase